MNDFEMAASFSGEFDSHNAIVSIFAGAGGVDAADWTQMLARMYLRWAESKGFSTQIVDESPAEEAGLKSITFFVRGRNAYGMLESERGVHRLVRLSPFDAAHRRHTSFAAVDVIPEIEADEKRRRDQARRPARRDVQIGRSRRPVREQDRIRGAHRPPADRHYRGVAARAFASAEPRGRADDSSREARVLAAQERNRRLDDLRGERQANEWGSQIRSYVLQPYQLVKDHRTGVETGNAAGVLDGDIDPFIWPYLQQRNAVRPA